MPSIEGKLSTTGIQYVTDGKARRKKYGVVLEEFWERGFRLKRSKLTS